MPDSSDVSIFGRLLFRLRSLTPVPFIFVLIFFSDLTVFSAIFGGILIVLGECLRIWAVGYAGGSTRTRTIGTARCLVTAGPYSHVRNPIYLGNLVLSLGVCLTANVYWMVVILGVGYLLQYVPIVLYEERYLSEMCGDVYRRYYDSVPRFLPNVRPYTNSSDHDFLLFRALINEKRTLTAIFCVVLLIIAKTLFL